MNSSSVWRQLKIYLADPVHTVHVLFVLLGGYSIALFFWELKHRQELAGYVLNNQLPSGEYPSLALLVGTSIFFCLLWLVLSLVIARRTGNSLESTLNRASGGFLALTLLPILLVLTLDGVEKEHPALVLGLVAIMGVVAAAAAATVQGQHVVEGSAGGQVTSSPLRARRATLGVLVVAVLTLGYIVTMSVITVLRHNAFQTHAFDLGIQDQVIYNILHSGRMVTTLLGPTTRVYDHFSPLFYVLAPVYALFQDARTLLILQSLFLGIGAIPVYLLAKDKIGRTSLAVALAACYLLYPALHGVNVGDFHQIAFVSSLLLFSLYFLERRRDLLFLTTLLLALTAKEEVALSVVAIGAYIVLAKRRWVLGLSLALFGLAYFVVTTLWLMPLMGAIGSAEYRYAGFLIPGKGLFESFFRTVVTNPLYPVVYVFSDPGKLQYLVQLLLPVLFLPLLAPLTAWVAALPAFLLPLLTNSSAVYGLGSHYPAHLIPFVFFLTVLALQRLHLSVRRQTTVAVSLLVVSLAMSFTNGQVISKQGALLQRSSEHTAVVGDFVAEIPAGASVSTLSDIVPHLSSRQQIYLFPIVNDAEYVLFDSDPTANFWPYDSRGARDESIRGLLPLLYSGEYGLVRAEDSVLLLQKGSDTTRNHEALRTLLSATYEAESQPSDLPVLDLADEEASGAKTRVALPGIHVDGGKEGLVYGPYASLSPGAYQVTYRLKHDGSVTPGTIATLDVFSNSAGGALASRDVQTSDFSTEGHYQDFTLDLETQQRYDDLEFRVLYKGLGTLTADAIRVTPLKVAVPVLNYEAASSPATADSLNVNRLLVNTEPTALIPGAYRALFTLETAHVGGTTPAGKIEVFSPTAGGPLAEWTLTTSDFVAPNQPQPFVLDFRIDQPWPDVTLRVFDGGSGILKVNRIDLQYLFEDRGYGEQ